MKEISCKNCINYLYIKGDGICKILSPPKILNKGSWAEMCSEYKLKK